jgi:hypothetical protein
MIELVHKLFLILGFVVFKRFEYVRLFILTILTTIRVRLQLTELPHAHKTIRYAELYTLRYVFLLLETADINFLYY